MKRPVDAEGLTGDIFTEHALRPGGIGHAEGDLIQEGTETDTCVTVLDHYHVA